MCAPESNAQVLPSRFPDGILSPQQRTDLTVIAKKCLEKSKQADHEKLLQSLKGGLTLGQKVTIDGLTSEKGLTLNGSNATIVEKENMKGRFGVKLEAGSKNGQKSGSSDTTVYHVKPANLRKNSSGPTYVDIQNQAISMT